jgi:hypothetical protein
VEDSPAETGLAGPFRKILLESKAAERMKTSRELPVKTHG